MKNTKYIKKGFECIEPNCKNRVGQVYRRCVQCAAKKRNRDLNYLKKQSLSQKGQKRSDEARKKMSIAQKKRFEDPKERSKCGKPCKGKANGMYIDGRTPIIVSLRHCKEYEDWRKEVFERDDYTCQDCGQRGGQLEAHHIKAFSVIFEEFIQKYNQFNMIEDRETLIRIAFTYEPFWNINNGKTLCENCHKDSYTTRPKFRK